MRVGLTAMIDAGTQGTVWRTTEGAVVKFTDSADEAVICSRLLALQRFGIDLPHLPKIRAVARAGGMFAVFRDDVPNIGEGRSEVLKADIFRFGQGWTADAADLVAPELESYPELRGVLSDLENFRDLTGITILDIAGAHNYGETDGRLVLRDLGMGDGIGPEMFGKIAWDDVEFVDPGPQEAEGPACA